MAKQSRQLAQTDTTTGDLAHERLPLDLDAAAARHDLERALLNAAHDQPAYCLGAGRAETAAAYLLTHLHRHRRDATTHTAITHTVTRARHAIDVPAGRAITVGPCPKNDCTGTIRAWLPTDDNRPANLGCDTNPQHTWDSSQWYRLGQRLLNRTATT